MDERIREKLVAKETYITSSRTALISSIGTDKIAYVFQISIPGDGTANRQVIIETEKGGIYTARKRIWVPPTGNEEWPKSSYSLNSPVLRMAEGEALYAHSDQLTGSSMAVTVIYTEDIL